MLKSFRTSFIDVNREKAFVVNLTGRFNIGVLI